MKKQKKTGPKEQNTKQTILKSAISEFIEYGYYGARMQSIANRAKVNKAMIHYYFRNKETIYKEVLNTVFDVLLEKLNKIPDAPVKPEKKIEQIMDVYIEMLEQYHDYARMVLYEIIRGGKEVRNILVKSIHKIPFNPVSGKIYKYFKNEIKKGAMKKVDVFQLIVSIIIQIAPVFFIKETFADVAGAMGIDRILLKKMIKERKKFVIELIMDGIKPTKGRD